MEFCPRASPQVPQCLPLVMPVNATACQRRSGNQLAPAGPALPCLAASCPACMSRNPGPYWCLQGDLDAAMNARSRHNGARIFNCEAIVAGAAAAAYARRLPCQHHNGCGVAQLLLSAARTRPTLRSSVSNQRGCLAAVPPHLQGTTEGGRLRWTSPAGWPVSMLDDAMQRMRSRCQPWTPSMRTCCVRQPAAAACWRPQCLPPPPADPQASSAIAPLPLVQTCTTAGCCT